jgi:uncharacterized tellurite resistance protein B-like protein
MFLGFLDQQQKLTFLGLARQVVTSDAHLRPDEVAKLDRMKDEMAISKEALVPIPSLDELPAIFTDRKSRSIVILELMGMSYVDSAFDWRENRLIADIAGRFDITEPQLTAMQQWVLRLRALVDEAIDLWS